MKTIKRALSILLAACLMAVCLPLSAFAADSDFVIVNGELTRYNGPGGAVTIPNGVTSISYYAFRDCSSLVSATIPRSVTKIESDAMEGCNSLTIHGYTGSYAEAFAKKVKCSFVSLNSGTDTGFTDVPADIWYAPSVAWAVENGITVGMTATTFGSENPCLREHAVTFLWRAAGSPEPTTTTNPFTDVASDAYYYKAVLWAVEKGITKGITATTFGPSQPCKREQIVTFLYRFENSPAVTGSAGFTDVASDAYYAAPVAWAVKNGITQGTGGGRFSPTDTCTRSQIVTFLYRDVVENAQ